jgi:mRNA interferase RelE/StbE
MFRVEFTRYAERQFDKLPRAVQVRLAQVITDLGANPRPPGSKKLSGVDPVFRIRSGDYRVIYDIRDAEVLVLVVAVGPRRDIYRR